MATVDLKNTNTVADLIRGALRLIGAIEPGQQPEPDELQDALYALNLMLDSWNTERLIVYTIEHPEYALTAGKQSYTLGPGGDWDAARPNRIEQAVLRVQTTGQPVDLPLHAYSDAEWAAIAVKGITGGYPYGFHDHRDFPQTTIDFFPIPAADYKFVPYVWTAISKFEATTEKVAFPPGYERAIRYGLAIELAPEWGKTVTPEVADTYRIAKSAIKRLNVEPIEMKCDAPSGDATQNGTDMAAFYSGWIR